MQQTKSTLAGERTQIFKPEFNEGQAQAVGFALKQTIRSLNGKKDAFSTDLKSRLLAGYNSLDTSQILSRTGADTGGMSISDAVDVCERLQTAIEYFLKEVESTRHIEGECDGWLPGDAAKDMIRDSASEEMPETFIEILHVANGNLPI